MRRARLPGRPGTASWRAALLRLGRWTRLAGLLLGIVPLLAVPAVLAQSSTQGALSGRVVDSRGGPLPGVVVRLSGPGEAAPMETQTDAEGRYRLSPVAPGRDYKVSAELPGYAKVLASPVILLPGRVTNLELTLRPSTDVTEVVTVTASGDIIDLASSQTSTRFNSEFLEGLPLLGRTYQDVLTLAPGVTDVDGDGNPNVNGARQSALQTRLDGANITDPFSGSYGQNLNLESIADLEVITSGASAEFGQAQGGFANIITKSGGNDFEGSFKTFFRSDLFDNDGANARDIDGRDLFAGLDGFDDLRVFLTLGGPIVRDRLWYFIALERINLEQPINTLTQPTLLTEEGWSNFAKITWQMAPSHRLALEVNHDPRTFGGVNVTTRTAPESAYSLERGGYSGSVKWSWTASPNLLVETQASWFDTGFGIVPLYEPEPCQPEIQPGRYTNCNQFARDDYRIDIRQGTISGPYYQTTQDERTRAALRSDVSYYLDGGGGSHSLRGGAEWSAESYRDDVETRPVRFDDFKICIAPPMGFDDPASPNFIPPQEREFYCDPSDLDVAVQPNQQAVIGSVNFEYGVPEEVERDADKQNLSLYFQDSWRPLPNLTVNLGLRVDRETTTVDGWSTFEPQEEAARFLALLALGEGVPVESLDIATALVHPFLLYDVNGDGLDTLHCSAYDVDGAALGDGMPDGALDDFLTLIDGDFDGRVDPDNPEDFYLVAPDGIADGASIHPQCDRLSDDADTVLSQFSRHQEDNTGGVYVNPNQPGNLLARLRTPETFTIANNNPAPRFSVTWDPWKDNRSKLFATWGRYYDRLFLATLVPEQGPDPRTEVFLAQNLSPFAISVQTGRYSLTQIDRGLKTPFTDELTLGFERELAPEWVLGATYIHRKGRNQLQDVDINHFTQDVNEDGLPDDYFGRVGVNSLAACGGGPCQIANVSDGQPDLFTYNPFVNQVLRIGNFNSSDYTAFQLTVTRRLSHRWQMTGSYVLSRAVGDAEEFRSPLGNDPGSVEDEAGPLDYDQRHVFKFAAVAWLPRNQSLGGSVVWSSGTPYSVVLRRESASNFGSFFFRTTFPMGQRNDQRNEGIWNIDLSYKKLFSFEPLQFAVTAEVSNLLNSDDLAVDELEPTQLLGLEATREFGRRWQLGLEFHF